MDIDWGSMALATFRVLLAGLIFGAGLPALFAVALRLRNDGAAGTSSDGTVTSGRPALTAASWVLFAVVVAIVLIAVLWITKSSLHHYFGWQPFGASK
ncbi:hypothetical protein [Arthrobacter sp. NPDC090010]|uniref:hypothetical protein n=1 Tax=Arthrobacter sp. NPDC090010 TaxID=3363942 RepID=UPI0038264C41